MGKSDFDKLCKYVNFFTFNNKEILNLILYIYNNIQDKTNNMIINIDKIGLNNNKELKDFLTKIVIDDFKKDKRFIPMFDKKKENTDILFKKSFIPFIARICISKENLLNILEIYEFNLFNVILKLTFFEKKKTLYY